MNKTTHKKDSSEAWEAFTSGSHVSFKEVFESYYPSMFGYGMKLCNEPELVRDCIQGLFRIIWERRDDLTHITSPKVYLFVSLRRKILKKAASRRTTNGSLKEIEEHDFVQFSREELIIRDEVKFQKKKELQEALNQLTSRQKEVIYLHYYNGMSYGEIEDILAINRQSVSNHIYRAMETLRSLLDTEIMKLVISMLLTFFLSGSSFF